MSESNIPRPENRESGEQFGHLFDLALEQYSTALLKNGRGDISYILGLTVEGMPMARIWLARDVDPARRGSEEFEILFRISELGDFESASHWLTSDQVDNKFIIIGQRNGDQRRAFKFQNKKITPFQPRLWSGKHWHRSPRSRQYYETMLDPQKGQLSPIPLREGQ